MKTISLKNIIHTVLFSFISIGCSDNSEKAITDPYNTILSASLIKKWETDPILSIPESAIYDNNKEVIYVSNVNSKMSGKVWNDNDGYISKISKNGIILSKKWITGLKAPKGIVQNFEHLYIADNNTIVDINTSNGKIINTFFAPKGTDHLNDITYDQTKNLIYVSDEQDNSIFEVTTNGEYTLFYTLEQNDKTYLNGLFVDNNKLIIQGEKGFLKSIDLKTKKVNNISNKMEKVMLDGIYRYNRTGYLVSEVGNNIYFVTNEGASKAFSIKNPTRVADISYSLKHDLLLAPNFKNKIIAYKVDVILKTENNVKENKTEKILN